MVVNVSGLGTGKYPTGTSGFTFSHEDADKKDVWSVKVQPANK